MATAAPLAIASLALTAIGTGMAVYGQMQQAQAAKKAGDYNAAVSKNNALAAQQQSAFEMARQREMNLRRMGSQKAGYAKSGITLDETASDVMSDTLISGELDVLATKYKGDMGFQRNMDESVLSTYSGNNAMRSGYTQAGATLISGVGKGVNTYMDMPRTNPQASKMPNPDFGRRY